jgi:CDP-diacylglycerol--glycerol-3-phosphate 3-phosphatidyltransferase
MLANLITLARLPLAALFAACVVLSGGPADLSAGWAAALVAVAACEELTDLFDGMVARRLGTVSPLGGILDPLADSIGRLTVYFAFALCGWVTVAVPLVMAGRDIVVAYTRIIQGLTGGKTSARVSGKVKAWVQGCGVFAIIALAAFQARLGAEAAGWVRIGIAAAVIGGTGWSLVDYVRGALPGVRRLARPAQ